MLCRRKGFKAELRTSNDIKFLKALKDHEADMNIIIERQPRSMNSSFIFTAPDCKHSEILALLKEFSIFDYEVFDPTFIPEQKPLQRSNLRAKPLDPEIVTSKYLSYEDGNTYIDALAAKIREAGSSVKVTTEGYSHEKREIKSITIENKSKPRNPVIFIDAGIHAREWHARAVRNIHYHFFFSSRLSLPLSLSFCSMGTKKLEKSYAQFNQSQ